MIEYRVLCDDCGAVLAASSVSVRAARAEAQLNRGANKGPDGDHCAECRKKSTTLTPEQREKAAAAAHSTGTRR
ncbi:MAG TPA: hypothetical protein VM711_07375 [Sphingomicrobium sp.]|nr:hypothetical protein [Sphingomicrobium sp.]